jgi:hypothetical protein
MSRPRTSFLAALAILIGASMPAVVQAENVGVSAVPDTFSSPPQRSKPTPSAAAHQRWHASNFSAPNGGLLVFTIMPNGNPACASYNGRDCLWGQTSGQIDFNRLRPLVCGADHRAKWGVTGYENPRHWCSVARTTGGGAPSKPQRLDDG